MITLRVLGPLEIAVDGAAPPNELTWRKHAALLAYLAMPPRRPRTRDQLVGLLWPEKPESAARHSLNEAVRIIRRAGGPEAVQSEGESVSLRAAAVHTDADAFNTCWQAGDWPATADLVAGELLEGLVVPDSSPFEEWLEASRREWRSRMLHALAEASARHVAEGRLDHAQAVAHRAVRLDPASETATRRLMEALALAGDRAAALGAYDALAEALQAAGIAPGAEIRRLAGSIRDARRPDTSSWTPPPDAVRQFPLLERESALNHLLSGMNVAIRNARTSLLVITGRDGCGRTRLAREVRDRAALAGASIAAMHAVPADVATDWSGLLVLARGGLVSAPGAGGAAPAALGALSARLPEWQEAFPGAVTSAEPVGWAIGEIVRAAALERPVLLIVDDGQWLDEPSRRQLLALLRDCAGQPVMVLLTVPSGVALPDLDEARAHIGREWEGAAVEVAPLSATAVGQLVDRQFAAWEPEARDRLVRRLMADTAGRPGFVLELLTAIEAGLDAATVRWPAPARTLDASFPAQMPDAVTAAIRVNFGRLSPLHQDVLAAIEALDTHAEPGALAGALDLPLRDLSRALDRLEADSWLLSDGRGYQFAARAVRAVIARDYLPAGRRRRLRIAAGLPPT